MTIKQKKAIENVVGNGGNITQAMRDAGYSENTINTPQKLTESVSWKELMGNYLPDDTLLKKAVEGLEATRVISAQVIVKSDDPRVKDRQATARDVDFIDVPDYAVRHKYLETSLKLKGHLSNDVHVATQVNIQLPEWARDEGR